MKISEVLREVRGKVERDQQYVCLLCDTVEGLCESPSRKYVEAWIAEKWPIDPKTRKPFYVAENLVRHRFGWEGDCIRRRRVESETREFRLAWIDEMIAELERNGK